MTDIERFMNQHDVNTLRIVEKSPTDFNAILKEYWYRLYGQQTDIDVNQPIAVEQGPAISVLESALAELDNRTSQIIHLSPSQAEALWIYIIKLKTVEALYDAIPDEYFWTEE